MSPVDSRSINLPAITVNGQALPAEPESVHAKQPNAMQPMGMCSCPLSTISRPMKHLKLTFDTILCIDPARPHEDRTTDLRGGDRSAACPGRFCFIIPCPLPCDFCIC